MLQILVAAYFNGFQNVHQRLAVKPRHVLAAVDHIVAFQRRDRHEADIVQPQLGGEGQVFLSDLVEAVFAEIHQIHLVHRYHDVPDTKQGGDKRVTASLGQHTTAGVDYQNGNLCRRGAGGHVAGVLLVSRCVCNDELALVGGEVTIGDIDGNALLALGLQAVNQ